jgi:hypothetical protein
MKKLLSLVVVAAFGFVVGCQKSDEDKAKDAMNDAGKNMEKAAKDAGNAAKDAAKAATNAVK